MDSMIQNKKMRTLPNPKDIRRCVLTTDKPILFHGLLNSWSIINWSLKDWSLQFANKQLLFRIGSKACQKTPQWENICKNLSCTFEEFIQKAENADDSWMYFDYKYMHEHFQSESSILKAVSWADLGFDGKTGEDSTIWIGSEGAHTCCHMDTYGCNVVTQIYGRKLWVMVAPEHTTLMKPMRVPYEESSVYSAVNFNCGASDLPKLKEVYVTELCPGDVLVVPKHWWHYVENLTTAISINMWIPLPSDDDSRLEESLVRYFITSVVKNIPSDEQHFLLNPNEIDLSSEINTEQQINWCIKNCHKTNEQSDDKRMCVLDELRDKHGDVVTLVPTVGVDKLREKLLSKCKCSDHRTVSGTATDGREQYAMAQHIINAFCHPDVITKVKDILMQQIRPDA